MVPPLMRRHNKGPAFLPACGEEQVPNLSNLAKCTKYNGI